MAQQAERHAKTGAAKTPTPAEVAPRSSGRTPAQVQAEQQRLANSDRQQKVAAPQQQQPLPLTPQRSLVPAAPVAPAPVNAEAMERHLSSWGGLSSRTISFNGSTGVHRITGEDTEIPAGSRYALVYAMIRQGFINFGEGGPPSVVEVGIGEDAEVPTRESLGDTDESLWPISDLTGRPDDPWKPQVTFPLVRVDRDVEFYTYVSRGVVALNAARDLLGKLRWSPQRHRGLLPVVELNSGTYQSKKFGPRPKPVLKIVGWVNPDGTPAAAPEAGKLPAKGGTSAADFNDSVDHI